MKQLTSSAAWLIIAEAFMRRAEGETQFTVQGVNVKGIASEGLCHAVGTLEDEGLLQHDAIFDMYDTVDYATRTLDEEGNDLSWQPWPNRTPRHRPFRATLALILHKDALAREAAIQAVPVGTGL